MNTNDLRNQLHADADAVRPPDAGRRVHHVRKLNRIRRRRKAGALVVCGAAAVVATAAVPVLDRPGSDEVSTAERNQQAYEQLNADDYPETWDGAELLGTVSGAPGEDSVKLTTRATSTDLGMAISCPTLDVPRGINQVDSMVTIYINGKTLTPIGNSCGPGYVFPTGAEMNGYRLDPKRDPKKLESLGVRAGEPVTVEVRLNPRWTAPASKQARLAFGLYDRADTVVNRDGMQFQRVLTRNPDGSEILNSDDYHPGESTDFALRDTEIRNNEKPGDSIHLTIPADGDNLLEFYGADGGQNWMKPVSELPDEPFGIGYGSYRASAVLSDDGSTYDVTLEDLERAGPLQTSSPHGPEPLTMYIAWYERQD